LERAGLIERRIERQWRFVRVRADALGAGRKAGLSRQRRHWTEALDRLEALAAAQTPRRKKSHERWRAERDHVCALSG